MEFLLVPTYRGTPPIPVPRTPYVSRTRYDGGPWDSYPARMGMSSLSAWDGNTFDQLEYHRLERLNPTPLEDLEQFLQTWLYFGLLAEFLRGDTSASESISSPPKDAKSKDIIEGIYKAILVPDGDKTFIKLDSDCLNSFLQDARPRIPNDPKVKKKYYDRLMLCLHCTNSVMWVVPKTFNHGVRCAIAALGELLTNTIYVASKLLEAQPTFTKLPGGWGFRRWFLDEDAKTSMQNHGWCISDIARIECKWTSVQGLYMARMVDKSLPKRNHSFCSDNSCLFYQINMGHYGLHHQRDGCQCATLEVDSEELTTILRKEDKFPVFRLRGKDSQNIRAEIVEAGPDVPDIQFIAISHVWADGLGNPDSNSLHKCKLHHLRALVTAIDQSSPVTDMDHHSPLKTEPSQDDEYPWIWLDTLLCPAKEGEGKRLAIEKIRLVYQQAKCVLVLDAGLMSYFARDQDSSEKLIRILTSAWMRRLWTLQEGALAKSLYFQFADAAVSFDDLIRDFMSSMNHMKYRTLFNDISNECHGLKWFFHWNHNDNINKSLQILDRSLQFRGVSVPTDEPLCIGALMCLDLNAILGVKPKENRMQRVWELIALQKGGIPAQVIFFQEPRIDVRGWKWAPRSFLTIQKGKDLTSRELRWIDKDLGTISEHGLGLKVQYPGYRIKMTLNYGDQKPRHPWPGFDRIPESSLHFRIAENGEWCRINDKEYAQLVDTWTTEEQREEYNKLRRFPLQDVANTDRSFFLTNSSGVFRDAIFATTAAEPNIEEVGIAVNTRRIVLFTHLPPEHGYIYETIRKLALTLRADTSTDRHLEIYNRLLEKLKDVENTPNLEKMMKESEELQSSIKLLKDKMREMVQEAALEDTRFRASVETHAETPLEYLWPLIYDFFNWDYEGHKIGADQVWFVD
jgi:hypothetical protein